MRQILFYIPFDVQIPLGDLRIPVFGWGLLLILWVAYAAWKIIPYARQRGCDGECISQVVVAGVIAALIVFLPTQIPRLPLYGFGAMLLVGVTSAVLFAAWRLRREGYEPEMAWDAAMWVLIPGILGARALFIFQNRADFFKDKAGQDLQGLDNLWAIFNLPRGGIVLYGGVIAASLSFYWFCRQRKLSPLAFGDIIIPSIFIGEMFGRIGCFLNGCCFGDVCTLPWGVEFPKESVPFLAELSRGWIASGAEHSRTLHPTQLYSSLNALVLGLLTWSYYPYRRRDGDVILVAWLTYPVTRFCLELLRGDELGYLGTPLTISQWISLLVLAAGLAFGVWLGRREPHPRVANWVPPDLAGKQPGLVAGRQTSPSDSVSSPA